MRLPHWRSVRSEWTGGVGADCWAEAVMGNRRNRIKNKHPTTNIEQPTSNNARTGDNWMFDVGCWVLDVFLFLKLLLLLIRGLLSDGNGLEIIFHDVVVFLDDGFGGDGGGLAVHGVQALDGIGLAGLALTAGERGAGAIAEFAGLARRAFAAVVRGRFVAEHFHVRAVAHRVAGLTGLAFALAAFAAFSLAFAEAEFPAAGHLAKRVAGCHFLQSQIGIEFAGVRAITALALAEHFFHFVAQTIREAKGLLAGASKHLARGLVGERF